MLVLTRKHQEKIRIGDHIVITVLKTKGKTVRLGIEAPSEVPVIRGELSFEGQAVEWRDESSANEGTASEPEQPRLPVCETKHVDRVRDHWPKNAQAKLVGARPACNVPRVSLQRVSREQVSQALPKVLGDKSLADVGPLRDMLNRRSVSA
jgi:carbon storage regulator CsrA